MKIMAKPKLKNLWLPCCLALAACGRPDIQIDATATKQQAGGAPVGLLEVHHANSGTFPGISLGETIADSRYCSAVLLADGRILTSTGCLRDNDTAYDIGQFEFHLNWTGNGPTEHWKLAGMDVGPSLSYLHPVQAGPDRPLATAISPQTSDLPLDAKTTSVPAQLVSITNPDKHGRAKAEVSAVTVEYSPSGFTATFTDTSVSLSTSTNTATTPSPIGTPSSTAISTATGTSVDTEVSVFRVNNLKAETEGSPVLVNGKVVGISQNPAMRSGMDNVSWIDKRAGQAPPPPAPSVPQQPAPSVPQQPAPSVPQQPAPLPPQ
jgi:hypothetical protein